MLQSEANNYGSNRRRIIIAPIGGELFALNVTKNPDSTVNEIIVIIVLKKTFYEIVSEPKKIQNSVRKMGFFLVQRLQL